MQKERKLDKLLIGISLVVVFFIVACLAIAPEGSQRVANTVKSFIIDTFGSGTLIFTLAGVVLLGGCCCSKYGKIKLGLILWSLLCIVAQAHHGIQENERTKNSCIFESDAV